MSAGWESTLPRAVLSSPPFTATLRHRFQGGQLAHGASLCGEPRSAAAVLQTPNSCGTSSSETPRSLCLAPRAAAAGAGALQLQGVTPP